jgi:hypothetical protein
MSRKEAINMNKSTTTGGTEVRTLTALEESFLGWALRAQADRWRESGDDTLEREACTMDALASYFERARRVVIELPDIPDPEKKEAI